MALEQRIESLKKRHGQIELEIHTELSHHAPDDIKLHHLKRQKLSLKDELESLLHNRRRAA